MENIDLNDLENKNDSNSVELIAKTYQSEFVLLEQGMLAFNRQTHSIIEHFETDVFPNYWSVAYADLSENAVVIGSKSGLNQINQLNILLLPPHSSVTWLLPKGEIKWSAFLISGSYPSGLPNNPVLAACTNLKDFQECKSKNELESLLKKMQWIDMSPPLSSKMKLIYDKIHSEFKSDKSFQEYADEINVSLSYLSRQFTKELHISPLQFRNKLRCMQVLGDLLFNGKKITESCFENGFQDVSHFNAVFKRIFTVTPSDFLKVNISLAEKDFQTKLERSY